MKVALDCFPCFLRQAAIALRLCTDDSALQSELIKALLPEIERADTSKSPAHVTTFMHRKLRRMLGRDPFARIKSEYNRLALGLYPELKEIVKNSGDPLFTASRLAIAGNVIDFGIFDSIDVQGTVRRALEGDIVRDDYPAFKKEIDGRAGEILYLLDNAGEIVFDRVLIEELAARGARVTAVVKGSEIINDATLKDAEEAGLTALCEVIDNGSDAVGTILGTCSPAFRERFASAPLIISKGQGNFETLLGESGRADEIFFLFQAKCGVVSDFLGVPLGSMLLKKAGD